MKKIVSKKFIGSTLVVCLGLVFSSSPSYAISWVPADKLCDLVSPSNLLKGKKYDKPEQLINTEFKVDRMEALTTEFLKSFKGQTYGKAFVGPTFWKTSFETIRVRNLYDTFVSFPEPVLLAAIIDLQKSSDDQIKKDAKVATALLHLAAPNLSANPNRWIQLMSEAGNEHYTVVALRARFHAYGGHPDLKVDVGSAMGRVQNAGEIVLKYRGPDKNRYEWDKDNQQVPSESLAFELMLSNPGRFAAYESRLPILREVKARQERLYNELPRTQVGVLFKKAKQENLNALDFNQKIFQNVQDGNKQKGVIEFVNSNRANLPGEKEVRGTTEPEYDIEYLDMMSQQKELDQKQKEMLAEAQKSRIKAQNYIAAAKNEIFGMATQCKSNCDDPNEQMIRAATFAPLMADSSNDLIRSCQVTTRYDQAMRAKSVASPPKTNPTEDPNTLNFNVAK
jgi:hypothetical protein